MSILSDYNKPNYKASVVSDIIYRDVNLDFIHPVSGQVMVDTDLDAIQNSIMNILMTPLGTRPFYPEFGSNVHNMLFEPITVSTTIFLKNEIEVAIDKFEKRISDISVEVEPNPDEHEYNVIIMYQAQYSQDNTHEFTLKRLR